MINYNSAIPYILGTYGEQEQLVKLTEECGELIVSANKRRETLMHSDDKSFTEVAESRNALAEEIADVLVVIEQITYAEGFEDDVRRIIDEKISRQLDRIKGVKV